MNRIKLGGLKILDGRTFVAASFRGTADLLSDRYLPPIVANRINLSLLTHVAYGEKQEQLTAFCTEAEAGPQSFSILRSLEMSRAAMSVSSDASILSIFPHDKNPKIAAAVFEAFGENEVHVLGVASSLSALSVVLFSSDLSKAVDSVFEPFDFPSYGSPYEWHAAYRDRSQTFREVIASYEEQIIKIYGFVSQTDLGLWLVSLPFSEMSALSSALDTIAGAGATMPFMIAQPHMQDRLLFALSLTNAHQDQVSRIFHRHLPDKAVNYGETVAMFHLHGPHFGDRFGIAHKMVSALEGEGLKLLALSCTVASISAIVPGQDLTSTLEVLKTVFEIPKTVAKTLPTSPKANIQKNF